MVFGKGADNPLAGVVRFAPIERLNAVLVISPQPAYLEQAQTWVERLDRGEDTDAPRIYVYHVENGRAEDLAVVLGQLFESGPVVAQSRPEPALAPGLSPAALRQSAVTPQLAPQPGQAAGTTTGAADTAAESRPPRRPTPGAAPGRRVTAALGEAVAELSRSAERPRIIADDVNNALVIMATPAQYRMIRATLKQLDIVPLQVLIEATIAEVSLTDDLRYGLQWFFNDANSFGEGTSQYTLSTMATGEVLPFFPGFNYFFIDTDIQVTLNALKEVTDLKVISSPQLMVLDNQTATLQVGDQVPIATQSAVSVTDPEAPIVNSIQFRDTGVILEVTPRVNASGLVVMDILQEVSDVVATDTSAIDSPTIQQRKIKTTVAVHSGQTIALGGLIRDIHVVGTTGVPLLSEIPYLGNLFKTTSDLTDRTELLVLITPRVVRDRNEAAAVTDELRKRLRALSPLERKIR